MRRIQMWYPLIIPPLLILWIIRTIVYELGGAGDWVFEIIVAGGKKSRRLWNL